MIYMLFNIKLLARPLAQIIFQQLCSNYSITLIRFQIFSKKSKKNIYFRTFSINFKIQFKEK